MAVTSRIRNRDKHDSRLRRCDRNSSDAITNSPACVIRLPACSINRMRASSAIGSSATRRRTCALVARLLTFCPPGPELAT